jgi:hypothetical protein
MRAVTKQTVSLLVILAVAVALLIGYRISTGYADAGQPGSVDDPIVTKSYVDQVVAEKVRQELQKFGGGGGGMELNVVTVPPGRSLMVSGGGEAIVRSGKMVVVSDGANGLSDLTEGADISPGKQVPANHLILFPRDGRGLKTVEEQTAESIVLVRGNYYIQ